MYALEQIRERLAARFPGMELTWVANPGPAAQHSLLLPVAAAREMALFLRDAPGLRFDYCSNVTGVDWPERPAKPSTSTPAVATPAPSVSTPATVAAIPTVVTGVADLGPLSSRPATSGTPSGVLEVVYHLYSMELKHGPVVIRLRTRNRTDDVAVPSLTPVWRSCEFQEREVFDLYGVTFEGHPDLRRILMWDEFKDHPMRRDYVAPDDFEWEPTPHDQVLARAKQHYRPAAATALPAPTTGKIGGGR